MHYNNKLRRRPRMVWCYSDEHLSSNSEDSLLSYELNDQQNYSRSLIVIAHPDDELFFFLPTILSLKAMNAEIGLCCLSHGKFSKSIRKPLNPRPSELAAFCEKLDIHILWPQTPPLHDEYTTVWPRVCILKAVKEVANYFQPTSIFTFDSCGVTKHPNHCSLGAYINSRALQCPVYKLRTQNPLCHYSSGLLVSQRSAKIVFKHRSSFTQLFELLNCYQSQKAWFRYLNLIFSSFLSVNVFD